MGAFGSVATLRKHLSFMEPVSLRREGKTFYKAATTGNSSPRKMNVSFFAVLFLCFSHSEQDTFPVALLQGPFAYQ